MCQVNVVDYILTLVYFRQTNFRPISRQQLASRNYFLTPCEIDHRNVLIVNQHVQANHALIFMSGSHLCLFFQFRTFYFFSV